MEDLCAETVEEPQFVFVHAGGVGKESVVLGAVGGEDIGEEERHTPEGDVFIGSVETGGTIGLHHDVYGIAPRGVTVEFGPFGVVHLPHPVDVPVAASPASPSIFAGADAEVFDNDVHVVVGDFIGFGIHGGKHFAYGVDGYAGVKRALWGRFAVVKMNTIGGGLLWVDMNPVVVFLAITLFSFH